MIKKKILLLDNYDSFTYNIYHTLKEIDNNIKIDVYRNDEISIKKALEYDRIILSPGPGLPHQAGIMMELLKQIEKKNKPTLGVCLGHQAICEHFGAKLFNHKKVYHGISSEAIIVSDDVIFKKISTPLIVGRYHSWSVSRDKLPSCIQITSETKNGTIMSIKHKEYNITGVQFHPESYMSLEQGKKILSNWLTKQ